ncbi:MAG: alpha-galactosidase [Actinomycetota bacterium]|jgi:alpha-galactosidase|nr:alpha-galactosidase [Actinomycetota bacterium]
MSASVPQPDVAPVEREPASGLLHLRASGVSLVLDLRDDGLPRVAHWGADLGDLDAAALESLALAVVPPATSNTLDDLGQLSVLPEHARGWFGAPGLSGHRAGADWSPLFRATSGERSTAGGTQRLVVEAVADAARLGLTLEVELTASGLVRMRGTVRNEHDRLPYTVDALMLALPVPSEANELLDLSGGHIRERTPQRQPFAVGARVRDNRRGRTGTDATLVVVAGAQGFGFRHGEVWGLHVGWSGNHRTYAERLNSGEAVLGGGELLLPGEVVLAPGESYAGPWLFASYAEGLDQLSHRFHEWLRARAAHPTRSKPRPVVLNTWEAVYMKHDHERLYALADAAAEVGAERYVLDDGWFRHRRDDHAGLGDWFVDDAVYPQGLHPLIRHVRDLGLEFGLWVEPEMVNPDSDLARAHPEWIMATGGRQPMLSRHQQVLDLGNQAAYDYILERLDSLLSDHPIDYLKWDHNRDLQDAGHQPGGEAGVHAQTRAVYRLMDELKRRHPGLEIESCSSGGGRVDLGVLEHADRVWASDSNDALERQRIQRWTGLLLPPEMVGSHIGPPHSHTTGRTHDLSFRAGTALFGHMGIEWDISSTTAEERAELRRWIALHKRFRDLLHRGTVVRADHPDPDVSLHGVVDRDGREGVFAVVSTGQRAWTRPGRVRLPGLLPGTPYRVSLLPPADTAPTNDTSAPPWLAAVPLVLAGSVLGNVGLELPGLYPEQLLLLHVAALETDGPPVSGGHRRRS